jgi:hypothetical protein
MSGIWKKYSSLLYLSYIWMNMPDLKSDQTASRDHQHHALIVLCENKSLFDIRYLVRNGKERDE